MVIPRRARWAVPGITALAIAAAIAIPNVSQAASPDLPDKTASELIQDIAAAEPTPLSGTLVSTARLGLPDLSSFAELSASPVNLLTGSTTIKVWADQDQGARMSLLGESTEYSVVVTPQDVWTYSSSDNTATHVTVPADALDKAEGMASAMPTDIPTPADAAEQALAAIDPTTAVAVDPTATVAGRDCYQLVVTPKQDGTLIGSIRIAIDAETDTPLRFQVWAAADPDSPAYELAFTDVSFAAPAASVFDFVPPAGASVDEVDPADLAALESEHADAKAAEKPDVSTIGEGWTQIVVVKGVGDLISQMSADSAASADASDSSDSSESTIMNEKLAHSPFGGQMSASDLDISQLLGQLGQQADGGMSFSTALFSVLITSDGTLYAGAVPVSALQAAAG